PTTTNTTQEFCASQNPTVADLQTNETPVIWYDAPTGGTAFAPTTALTNGIYYAAYQGATCESSVRLAVTANITDEATPTTTNTTQEFCASQNPTVADLQTNETPVIWYDAPTGGTAYAPTTALTNGIYYAAYQGATCESSIRLAVTANITDEATPTTTNTTQEFCASQNPTVADLQTNETPVIWYDAPTGGTAYAPTTALTNGIYYAAYQGATCESSIRLAVTANITDEATPTTTNTTQEFCASQNPTVADLQTNETPVIWYDAPTGGTAYAPTTALTNGIYYAAYQGATCESSVRLAVTANITDEATPTTTNTTQEFCASQNPTVADLQTNEIPVIWYDAPTGGTAYAPTTALTNGIYYAAYQGATCESSIRLAVTVIFNTTNEATIDGEVDTICYNNIYTYTTENNMSNYEWTIVGGTIVAGGDSASNYVTIDWDDVMSGSITVTYYDSSLCNGTATKTIDVTANMCSNLTITKVADKENAPVGDTVVFTITVNNEGTSDIENLEVSEYIPSGYTYVSHTTTKGLYNPTSGIWTIDELLANESAILTVTVTINSTGDYVNTATIITSNPLDATIGDNDASAEVGLMCLTVYNEFSPNSDGNNDYFIIDCIENYPNNSINIFNRHGHEVYQKDGYLNDWNGLANVSGVVNNGEPLPVGTYYYVLKIDEINYTKTGWLYIAR
ncbi:gliding motility-associated C-terminal domain-containing protein, partial [Flavobacterium chuncheonense]